ncbi:transcriptional regulator [Actinosynnema sp. ALI-1.44]|uniref:helix-turn-helix domain-containing protein n=1 Tax=Actinosynnema sp. ALI-1.44 TaxID=1933779 RepID=UPI00097CBCD7|nr:XRE family transcriptional regulator [Actinosynnema sp. ALI-1.44]ONI77347.1 transcriptional regulator [Actinosynnema sp. ALI-1.44]
MEAFGEALKALRTRAHISQSELAQAALWSQSQISRAEGGQFLPDLAMVERIDEVLQGQGRLTQAFHAAREPQPSSLVVANGSDPWDVSELLRRMRRTDVGKETVEQLEVVVEQLCCEYAWRDPEELRSDAKSWLQYVSQLLEGPVTLRDHRDLLVSAGWLTLLIGCLDYDLGRVRQAELTRVAAQSLGKETGHGEIVAWSFELSAWFALTQGRLRSVGEYAEAGTRSAPNASVAVQLAAQAAKAQARMNNKQSVQSALDHGYRLLAKHEHPTRPENHFVIDPNKWDFYAMDCYWMVGDNKRAAEHAHEVIRLSQRPDGTEKSPMRASEARFVLAVIAARTGDIDAAAEWTRTALAISRKSMGTLSMVVEDIIGEIHHAYPNDPGARAIIDEVRTTRKSFPNA